MTLLPRGELSSHEHAVGLRYSLVVVCLTRDIFVLLYRPFLGQVGHADFLPLINEQRPGQGTLHKAQQLGREGAVLRRRRIAKPRD